MAVREDLELIQQIVDKVSSYFNAKSDGLVSKREDLIFGSLAQPSESEVGHLISLQCGHTARPNDVETMMIGMHLERAGFVSHPSQAPKKSVRVSTKLLKKSPEKQEPKVARTMATTATMNEGA